jgi:uncharacterized Fe-S cluster-containing radical SAM superfamily protein
MSKAATKMRLEEIKPHLITKLKMAAIESVFDLAISIPHQLIEDGGGMLIGADEHALDLVMKAKKALVDSGLLSKDFSTVQGMSERKPKYFHFCNKSSRHVFDDSLSLSVSL